MCEPHVAGRSITKIRLGDRYLFKGKKRVKVPGKTKYGEAGERLVQQILYFQEREQYGVVIDGKGWIVNTEKQ